MAVAEAIKFGPRERLLLAVLLVAYPKAVTIEKFIDLVYADDPDGGPLDAEGCIEVAMVRVRKLCARAGLEIANAGRQFQILFPGDRKAPHLGRCERQIYDAIKGSPGLSPKDVSSLLDTHRSTLHAHLNHIRRKLAVSGDERLISERDPLDKRDVRYRIVNIAQASAPDSGLQTSPGDGA